MIYVVLEVSVITYLVPTYVFVLTDSKEGESVNLAIYHLKVKGQFKNNVNLFKPIT